MNKTVLENENLHEFLRELTLKNGLILTREKKQLKLHPLTPSERGGLGLPSNGYQDWKEVDAGEALEKCIVEQYNAVEEEEVHVRICKSFIGAFGFYEGLQSGQLGDDRISVSAPIFIGQNNSGRGDSYALLWVIPDGVEEYELVDTREEEDQRFTRELSNLQAEGKVIWVNDPNGHTLLRISSETPIEFVSAPENSSEFIDLRVPAVTILTNNPPKR